MHNSDIRELSSVRQCDIAVETKTESEMKLKHVVLEEYIQPASDIQIDFSNTLCIIYMIDGTKPDVKKEGAFVTSLFNNPAFKENPVPILFAVNKSDLKNCKFNTFVYDGIESEVGKLLQMEDYSFRKYAPCTLYSFNCSVLENNCKSFLEFIQATL